MSILSQNRNKFGEQRDSQAASGQRLANHENESCTLARIQESLISVCDWQQHIDNTIQSVQQELAEIKRLLQMLGSQCFIEKKVTKVDSAGDVTCSVSGNLSPMMEDILYAGACSKGIFTSVTTEPIQGKTIYQLFLAGNNEARFEVYQGAIQKVVQDSNFLTGACKIEGGGSRLQTKKKGTAQKDELGWKLINPAQVEFY